MTKPKAEIFGADFNTARLRAEMGRFLLETKEHFILLFGMRGPGKSYTTQKTIIDDCLLNNTEFCFCVPTKQLKEHGALKKWVAKCFYKEFPQYQTRVTTDYFFVRRNDNEDWQLLGHCLALSGADNDNKNDSSLFNVNWMIWDESMRYKLEINAATVLIDLFLMSYHTIDREENRVKAVFIGNALNKLDPLFEFFKVGVPELKRPGVIVRDFNKIAWYVPRPADLADDPDNTFRQMIKGTRYGEIADGEFNLSYGELIGDPGAEPVTSCYALQFSDDGYLLFMPACGNIYIESCNREFAEKYATSHFTAIVKEATKDRPFAPLEFVNMIRQALTLGRCKFVDEESLLTGSARLKTCFNITVL